jgi:hypothetical protein
VSGVPEWLAVRPTAFHLQPGGQEIVEFVGLMDKVRGRRREALIEIQVDGGQAQRVAVTLQRGGILG